MQNIVKEGNKGRPINKTDAIASFIAYVLAYSYALSFVFDLVLPISGYSLTYFTGVFGFAGVVLYFSPIIRGESVPRAYYANILILIFFAASILLVFATYGNRVLEQQGAFASFFARAVPSLFIGSFVALRGSFTRSDAWVAPLFVAVSAILFSAVLSSQASAMVTLVDQGIDRQTLSYAASFALCLGLYYFSHSKKLNIPRWQKSAPFFIVALLCAMLDIVAVFAGGGRGAVIVCLVFLAYYFIRNRVLLSLKKVVLIIAVVAFSLSAYAMIPFPSSSVGVDRIITFFSGAMDQSSMERVQLYEKSLNLFLASPIMGYGAGGALCELGIWPHNIFLNILVDFGVIGFAVFLAAFVFCTIRLHNCIKIDFRNELIFIIGATSFIELLFSGTYLSDGGVWLTFGFCLTASSSLLGTKGSFTRPRPGRSL